MENIGLESTIQVWSFTIDNVWFELQFNTSEKIITNIFREDNKELTDRERNLINTWVKTL